MTAEFPGARRRGFTLLEVLVATAIFAVAALGLLNAQSSQVRTNQHLGDKTFAHWVALNRLAELRLEKAFPEVGQGESTARMAGREWLVTTQVQATPVANVRLVVISVAENSRDFGDKPPPITRVTGFLPRVSSDAPPSS